VIDQHARDHNDAAFCRAVQDEIDRFLNEIDDFTGQIVTRLPVRVFIGHCQQTGALDSYPNQVYETFDHLIETTEIRQVYDNLRRVSATADPNDLAHNRTFGITTECHLPGQIQGHFQPQIIKLDVAVGRGQDDPSIMQRMFYPTRNNVQNQYAIDQAFPTMLKPRTYLMPRVPQVVSIQETPVRDVLRLIRSTLQNTINRVERFYNLYYNTFVENGQLRQDPQHRAFPALGMKKRKSRSRRKSKSKRKSRSKRTSRSKRYRK